MARDISALTGLADALAADTVNISQQVLIELGNNRFNDDQAITSSGTKSSNVGFHPVDGVGDKPVEFWRAEDAFNNKNRLGMKWAVADAGALVYDVADGSGYRCVPLQDGDYERGWWGTSGSGWVQSEWTVGRLINRITLYSMEGYPNISNATVEYKTASGWQTAYSGSIGSSTYVNSWDITEVECTGLKVTVNSMYGGSARVSELQGLYVVDVSDRVISFDITETREEYNSTVPIGTTASNSFSLELDNVDGEFNMFGGSTYGPYLAEGNKVEIYLGANVEYVQTGTFTPADNKRTKMGEFYTDDWSLDTSSMTARCSGRDASKYLQDDSTPWPRMWRDTTAAEIAREIFMINGFPYDSINIVETELDGSNPTTFPVVFLKEEQPWSFLGEIALADQAMFGIDSNGDAYYESIGSLPGVPTKTLSGDTNVISASIKTEVYLNKVTVKVNSRDTESIETTMLWTAPNPTILSYSKLSGGIGPTDTTINIQAADRQDTASLIDNGWPEKNGILFLPTITYETFSTVNGDFEMPTVTGGELVKYGTRTATSFLDCERGYLYTEAASHSDGAYIGEARLFNMEFSNTPALSVNYPYVTAIDALSIEPYELTKQAHVCWFVYDSLGGQLCVANIAEFLTWLSGTAESLRGFDLENQTLEYNWATSVSGKAAVEKGKQRVGETIDNPSRSINNLVRKFGKNDIEIDNPWIQTVDHAQNLVDYMIEQYQEPRRIINLTCTGDVELETGDMVALQDIDQLGIGETPVYGHVIEARHVYDGGLQSSYVVREYHGTVSL